MKHSERNIFQLFRKLALNCMLLIYFGLLVDTSTEEDIHFLRGLLRSGLEAYNIKEQWNAVGVYPLPAGNEGVCLQARILKTCQEYDEFYRGLQSFIREFHFEAGHFDVVSNNNLLQLKHLNDWAWPIIPYSLHFIKQYRFVKHAFLSMDAAARYITLFMVSVKQPGYFQLIGILDLNVGLLEIQTSTGELDLCSNSDFERLSNMKQEAWSWKQQFLEEHVEALDLVLLFDDQYLKLQRTLDKLIQQKSAYFDGEKEVKS